jgi:peptidoglycan/LPS O-acetylase OafA/YrhL
MAVAAAPALLGTPRREHRLELGVLDGLRGLAALYVVAFHSTRFLWAHGPGVAFVATATTTAAVHIWLTAMQYGQQAVLLFFVLSGFCIHYRQARTAATDPTRKSSFNLVDFARRRFRRLYPVLLVAIAATAALDFAGSTINPAVYNGSPGLYDGVLGHPFNQDLVVRSYAVATLLGNLLLQATTVVPAFGSNDALWSLTYEFWFYAAYPIFLLMSRPLGPWRTLSVVTVVSLVGLALTRLSAIPVPYPVGAVASHWATWVSGAVVAELYVSRSQRIPPRVLGVIGGVIVVALLLLRPGGGPAKASWQDLPWGLALGMLLAWAMLSSPRSAAGRTLETAARLLKPLGNISYSLYVLHLPWVLFLAAVWLALAPVLPLGPELIVAGVASSLAMATICWYFVERHFISDRRKREPMVARTATLQLPAAEVRPLRSS